jgi:hypothetical protein
MGGSPRLVVGMPYPCHRDHELGVNQLRDHAICADAQAPSAQRNATSSLARADPCFGMAVNACQTPAPSCQFPQIRPLLALGCAAVTPVR